MTADSPYDEPLKTWRADIAKGTLHYDAAQEKIAQRLTLLNQELASYKPRSLPFFKKPPRPRGVYLWGSVGRGKSMLMDIFYKTAPLSHKKRLHFHAFMQDVHERLDRVRQGTHMPQNHHRHGRKKESEDPVDPVARGLMNEFKLLCLDEMDIKDIADAMLVGRLFTSLFSYGLILITTSNRPPQDLYKNGLNRALFLPFTDLLDSNVDSLCLDGETDYRRQAPEDQKIYLTPLDRQARSDMEALWTLWTQGAHEDSMPLSFKGRKLFVPRMAGTCARFTFEEIFEAPLGIADYLALAAHFDMVFVEGMPLLGPDQRNAARRFILLIDALYETGGALVLSAAGSPDMLYREGLEAFEFQRALSRLKEMGSRDYLKRLQEKQIKKDHHKYFRVGDFNR